MFKKAKLPVAITLLVQSFAFLILFIILACKKKSIAGAFLAIAAVEGVAGGALLASMKKELCSTVVDFDEEDFEVDEVELRADLAHAAHAEEEE